MKIDAVCLRAVVVAAALMAGSSVQAANLEKNVRSRWLGAWVITTVDTYSDCRGMYTNNRINGTLVKSSGAHRFPVGELARVDKIDVNRSRVDVLLSIPEPLLLPYQDGPFTLYTEADCEVELEVVLARETVKTKDADRVESKLEAVLERFPRLEQARESAAWNERQMEPYPDDYETVLGEHAVWQATRTNDAIQGRIDQAVEETSRVVQRVSTDADYLAGFASGVEDARAVRLSDCPALMSVRLSRPARSVSGKSPVDRAHARGDEGRRDGRTLVLGLEMVRRLPECFVPVPELPIAGMTAPRSGQAVR